MRDKKMLLSDDEKREIAEKLLKKVAQTRYGLYHFVPRYTKNWNRRVERIVDLLTDVSRYRAKKLLIVARSQNGMPRHRVMVNGVKYDAVPVGSTMFTHLRGYVLLAAFVNN